LSDLPASPQHVLLERVDVLVTENLRQATVVIGVIDNKLMTRAVPTEVRI
jgi:hypothetical protein